MHPARADYALDVSWATYPALDPSRPAGRPVREGELRQRLHFTGVTISDGIEAGALAPFGGVGRRSVLATSAGADLILACAANPEDNSSLLAPAPRSFEPGFDPGSARLRPVHQGRSVAAWIPDGLTRRLKQLSGVASSQDLDRLDMGSSRRSAEVNHGLVMLARRVTMLEDPAPAAVTQARFETLQVSFDELQVSFDNLQVSFDGMSAQIEALRGHLGTMNVDLVARTDGLIVQHAESREWLTGLDQRVENLSRRVAGANLLRDSSEAIEQFADADFGRVEGFRRPHGEHADDAGIYIGFEGWFRGTEQAITDRQRVYVAALRDHAPVLDVGCGRGELLELLAGEGIAASGVDADSAMVARCREKDLDVTEADAVAALFSAEAGSLGAVFAAQVIEHLPYPQLIGFLAAARSALRPDGLLIVETVNPHSPQGLKHFWVDPTHQHPLFPETVLSLCHFSGYREAFCWYPQGSGDPDADRLTQLDYAIVARRG